MPEDQELSHAWTNAYQDRQRWDFFYSKSGRVLSIQLKPEYRQG